MNYYVIIVVSALCGQVHYHSMIVRARYLLQRPSQLLLVLGLSQVASIWAKHCDMLSAQHAQLDLESKHSSVRCLVNAH